MAGHVQVPISRRFPVDLADRRSPPAYSGYPAIASGLYRRDPYSGLLGRMAGLRNSPGCEFQLQRRTASRNHFDLQTPRQTLTGAVTQENASLEGTERQRLVV